MDNMNNEVVNTEEAVMVEQPVDCDIETVAEQPAKKVNTDFAKGFGAGAAVTGGLVTLGYLCVKFVPKAWRWLKAKREAAKAKREEAMAAQQAESINSEGDFVEE